MFFPSQLAKKKIWCPRSLKHDKSTSFLSSLVLDASEELPHHEPLKDKRFIYRFVHQDLPAFNMKASDGNSSVASSPRNYMDSMLRSGDYVVKFSHIRFVQDVVFVEFT